MQSSGGPYQEERREDREGWRAVFSPRLRGSESAQLEKNRPSEQPATYSESLRRCSFTSSRCFSLYRRCSSASLIL